VFIRFFFQNGTRTGENPGGKYIWDYFGSSFHWQTNVKLRCGYTQSWQTFEVSSAVAQTTSGCVYDWAPVTTQHNDYNLRYTLEVPVASMQHTFGDKCITAMHRDYDQRCTLHYLNGATYECNKCVQQSQDTNYNTMRTYKEAGVYWHQHLDTAWNDDLNVVMRTISFDAMWNYKKASVYWHQSLGTTWNNDLDARVYRHRHDWIT
jgi:hypothetical protein